VRLPTAQNDELAAVAAFTGLAALHTLADQFLCETPLRVKPGVAAS